MEGETNGASNFEAGLDNRGINGLREDIFWGMDFLLTLRLNNNELPALPKMVFRDLINLRILHLGGNKIDSLEPRTFGKLRSLQQLDIGGNLLDKIPVSAFKGLFNLQSLILSSNRLKTLPGEIFKALMRLEILDLQSNRLESLPYNVLTGLASLRELYLQDNQLPELPARMFANLTRLQVAIFVPAPYGCALARPHEPHAHTYVLPSTHSLIVLSLLSCIFLASLAVSPAGRSLARALAIQVLNLEQNPMKALQPPVYYSLVKMLANRYDLEEVTYMHRSTNVCLYAHEQGCASTRQSIGTRRVDSHARTHVCTILSQMYA